MRKTPLFRFRRDLVSVWLGAALLLVVLAPLTLHSQTGLGTILGRVTDHSGAVVPGATVTRATKPQTFQVRRKLTGPENTCSPI